MRAVIQRVTQASVDVNDTCVGSIGPGVVVLLGVTHGDSEQDANYLVEKISNLRIFQDQQGKMNRSLIDTNGGAIVISQFTLYGDCRKGRRPSFDEAARPDQARRLYEYFLELFQSRGLKVAAGVFQAHMKVTLTNDGPVTLVIDSKKS
jgi:D-tyrosyl-tRNA(Tyr) deacylase